MCLGAIGHLHQSGCSRLFTLAELAQPHESFTKKVGWWRDGQRAVMGILFSKSDVDHYGPIF